MDYEPWQEPEDEGRKLPRSWQEIRERWQGDMLLRVILGISVVIAIIVFLSCAGLRL